MQGSLVYVVARQRGHACLPCLHCWHKVQTHALLPYGAGSAEACCFETLPLDGQVQDHVALEADIPVGKGLVMLPANVALMGAQVLRGRGVAWPGLHGEERVGWDGWAQEVRGKDFAGVGQRLALGAAV